MKNWKSSNGIWWIHKLKGKWVIEDMRDGCIDFPIIYKSRKIAFDNPFILPKYVKLQFKKMVGGY